MPERAGAERAESGRSEPERESHDPQSQLDSTKMINQPALRSSSGLVWLIMGTLFAVAVLIPFTMLAFAGGPSRRIALGCAIAVVILYAGLIAVRLTVRRRVLWLRAMAVCFLTMAAVSVIGMWVCAMLENAQISSQA